MSDTVIQIENLSKQYRLGVVGTGTLSHDLNRWWAKLRGKPDPYLRVDQLSVNRYQLSGSRAAISGLSSLDLTDLRLLTSDLWILRTTRIWRVSEAPSSNQNAPPAS